MKTKEISFDAIQKIKANNKLAESLQKIEDIANGIYWNDLQLQELNVEPVLKYFKELEDIEELTSSEFVYAISQFCEINQRFLSDNSKSLIQ